MTWYQVKEALFETGLSVAQLIMIAGMAGVVSGVLKLTGFSPILTKAIISLGDGNLFFVLVMTAILCFVLGLGMPTVAVYVLLSDLAVPSMIEVGVPAIAAHLFVLYFGVLSMITPPVGPAALAASVVAKSDFIKTGITAVIFAWPAYVIPFIFTQDISLLWQGSAFDIIRVFAFSLMGVYLISCACIGYIFSPISVFWRIGLIMLGIACLLPASSTLGTAVTFNEHLSLGFMVNLCGFVISIAMLIFYHKKCHHLPLTV